MNGQIAQQHRALHEDVIGPPIEADVAEIGVPVLKPTKRKLITTMALTIHTCRWPLGDPVDADFHYCGERPLMGHPYCDMHHAQCYPRARRKKAAAKSQSASAGIRMEGKLRLA
jgi:hypothetical protein